MKQQTTILDKIYDEAQSRRIVLTIDEYAKKIGKSRATLYRYRGSPESILFRDLPSFAKRVTQN